MKLAIRKSSKIFVCGKGVIMCKTIHVLIKVSSLVCQDEGEELSVKLFFIVIDIMKPM